MPFDASGNFTRAYNFQQDAANGIKILAARVDGEFDNVATGMNLVFFRDGRVPMQADLRMNINGITGLKDGALGSPAIKFNTDPNTGAFLPGLNQYGIQVNSIQRGNFTTAGFDVTGNFTASGTISEGGSLLSTKYLTAASPTFTGTLSGPVHAVTGAGGAITYAPRDGTTGTTTLYSNTANTLRIQQNAVDQFALSPTGLTITPSCFFNTVNATQYVAGNNAIGGTGVYLNSASGSVRTLGFQTAGAYAGEISLQTNNVDFKYNSNGGIHQFSVTGTEYARVSSSGLSAAVHNVTGSSGALTFQPRDLSAGTAMLYSPTTKSFTINDGAGSDVCQFDSSGRALLVKSGGCYWVNGVADATYNIGYKHSRTGQVGYHMYNGGGVCEWLMYQPAHASGDDFRVATYVGGTVTDRFKVDNGGTVYALGHQSLGGELWVGGTSGVGTVRFGNGSASTKYLYYDGTNFNLSASLVVGGNISSSSDARLKSNIRDLPNGLDMVRALQPKRFTMYGKPDLGFVAQELLPVAPEVISVDAKGYMAVDYGRLTAVLASAVKTLDERLSAVERLLAL